MIRLTKSQHHSNTAVDVDRRWYLDPGLKFEVHGLPPVSPGQAVGYPKAGALICINGEAHYVDESVELVLKLIKIARNPQRYRLVSNEMLIAHEALIYVGGEADGELVFGLMESYL